VPAVWKKMLYGISCPHEVCRLEYIEFIVYKILSRVINSKEPKSVCACSGFFNILCGFHPCRKGIADPCLKRFRIVIAGDDTRDEPDNSFTNKIYPGQKHILPHPEMFQTHADNIR